ncbi:hypothetical protein H6B11_08580 [Mediterraneibacter glycyrrhizinilyticus]|nr:hypothetical protein [Mediterraneibacter glycyrrhizinilyticus]MBM6854211.1 hypothetical protein [Mediterraneibacter glycyrrhizinilyticus]
MGDKEHFVTPEAKYAGSGMGMTGKDHDVLKNSPPWYFFVRKRKEKYISFEI